MALFTRVRTLFTGVAGSPWYSNLYFDDDGVNAQLALDQVEDLWTAVGVHMVNDVHWTIEDTVTILDTVTGQPTGVVSGTGADAAGGQTSDPLPVGAQLLVRLNTGVFLNGRQVVGHVFVPAFSEGDNTTLGTCDAGTATAVAGNFDALTTTPGNLTQVVWSRTGSAVYPVSSVAANTKWTFLRSRRD